MSQSHVLRAPTRSVDLGESFPTSIYLQISASIQPRTSPVKFARSSRTDRRGVARDDGAVAARAVGEGAQTDLGQDLRGAAGPLEVHREDRERDARR